MQVRFFDFSQFHNKIPPSGSTNIRVHQLIKYWPEAGSYQYGENPDALIFQKVYLNFDYQFPAHFENTKILDICDPDWDNIYFVRRTVDVMDAVVTSSDGLRDFIKQWTDKPVITIPDRFDMSLVPNPKKHEGRAKTVVWFGYRHNSETIKPALNKIMELGLNLLVISDDDPMIWQYYIADMGEQFRRNRYTYLRYDEETIYQDLQKADMAILPQGTRPQDKFKSNNKTIKAQLAGLPVAYDIDTLLHYMEAENRNKFIDDSYAIIKAEYDVRKSVEEYKELIRAIRIKG